MEIVVDRIKEYAGIKKPRHNKVEGATIGILKMVDDKGKVVYKCFTLENEGSSTDTPKMDKRIIAREYNLEWTNTGVTVPPAYNGRGLLLTCDYILPKFRHRRILIHIGNYPQDTEGCLLLGEKDNLNGTIGFSTVAVKKFYDKVKEVGVENCKLIINELKD